MQCFHLSCISLVFETALLFGIVPLTAQEITAPTYNHALLRSCTDDMSEAWKKWREVDSGLEQRVFRVPMRDARNLVQAALGRYLNFLEKRSVYASTAAEYIDASRREVRSRTSRITLEEAYGNQIELLSLNTKLLQDKLTSLRSSAEWFAIRRQVRSSIEEAMAVSVSRQTELPQDVSLGQPPPASAITSASYKASEQQLVRTLRNLWTVYYQALVDAAEKNPNGPVRLVPSVGPESDAVKSGLPALPTFAAPESPLVGAWKYAEGSHQFNAADEPRNVMLELWTEKGILMGRYRAELPGFKGLKHVDVRLRRSATEPLGKTSLQIDSSDPASAGRIILEGPGPTGMELMLIREVDARGAIPRGREILHRY